MIHQLNSEYFVRPLLESDVDGPYLSWFDDQEVCRFNSHGKFVRTEVALRDFITRQNRNESVVWAICHQTDGHVGNISLQSLSFVNRHAEFAILLGDRRHWGRGLGTLAGRALVEHGFLKLNLHRIYCGTAAANEGMKCLALALGMREEGIRREHLFLEGRWQDVVEYGVLRSEFLPPATQ